jgi:hypothetical protein
MPFFGSVFFSQNGVTYCKLKALIPAKKRGKPGSGLFFHPFSEREK